MRDFIAEVSYLIFRGWFKNLEKKNIYVLDKLFEETTHFIITDSSEFKKIYNLKLKQLI